MTISQAAPSPTAEPEISSRRAQRSRRRPAVALRRLSRDLRATVSVVLLVLVVIAGIAGPWLAPASPTEIDATRLLQGPSADHLFGTDELGRDVLSRVLVGSRVTLQVAVVGVGMALVLGTLIGLLSGYRGGWLDAVLMRVVDGFLAFPMLVLALAVVAALGPGVRNALIAITVVNIPRFARVVRGQVLGLRTRDYVSAAQILGVPSGRLMRRHILPHLADVLLVFSALAASAAIVAEASLSFLGLSTQPPAPSWGGMVASGVQQLETNWAMSVFPGIALLLTVGALNVLADALRDDRDASTGIGQTETR